MRSSKQLDIVVIVINTADISRLRDRCLPLLSEQVTWCAFPVLCLGEFVLNWTPGFFGCLEFYLEEDVCFWLKLCNSGLHYFFLSQSLHVLFLFLIVLAITSRITLKSNGERGHLSLIPDFNGKTSSFLKLCVNCRFFGRYSLWSWGSPLLFLVYYWFL